MEEKTMPIDTSTPIPIYYQIKQEILKKITGGEVKPGDRIESEEKLAKRYEISRMTARHAVTQLVNEGYLYRVHGKGTFVCKPRVEKSVATLTGFADDMKKKGFESHSDVISLTKMIPNDDILETLNLKPNDEVYCLIRVRYANKVEMSYQECYLPADMFPEIDRYDFSNHGLYETINDKYEIEPLHANQRMEARTATGKIAEYLHVDDGSPIFFVERITYEENQKPMELANSWHRGDKYVFEMKLYRES
jgi:GntR family transcriptional regulator